jgi:hypothetical protein
MAAAQGVRARLKAPVTTTYLAPGGHQTAHLGTQLAPGLAHIGTSIWALVWVPARTAAICTMMSLKPPLMISTSFGADGVGGQEAVHLLGHRQRGGCHPPHLA